MFPPSLFFLISEEESLRSLSGLSSSKAESRQQTDHTHDMTAPNRRGGLPWWVPLPLPPQSQSQSQSQMLQQDATATTTATLNRRACACSLSISLPQAMHAPPVSHQQLSPLLHALLLTAPCWPSRRSSSASPSPSSGSSWRSWRGVRRRRRAWGSRRRPTGCTSRGCRPGS